MDTTKEKPTTQVSLRNIDQIKAISDQLSSFRRTHSEWSRSKLRIHVPGDRYKSHVANVGQTLHQAILQDLNDRIETCKRQLKQYGVES